jgi:hypothetical protein
VKKKVPLIKRYFRVFEVCPGIGGRLIKTFSSRDEAEKFGKSLGEFGIEVVDQAGKVVS